MKFILSIFGLCVVVPSLLLAEPLDKALVKERANAEARLSGSTNQVVFAVDGLCCKSCGIGIGNKVCKLEFIDTSVLPKGVEVHRKEALLSVAVKNNEAVNLASLVSAIRKAGYEPVRLYERSDDGALTSTDIPKE
ncbi:MAG: hypothetical protein OSB41_07150 [Kiritimatiellae bacterium]|nr:hypothetical protein [Kiritimatiellia bacterium]